MSNIYENPFQITTPENLSAEEMASLFVDVFNDFSKILDPGHAFLIGPRGSGKSMMLRFMQPDCQCLTRACKIGELPFLALYISLKNTNFSLSELQRLENRHASEILNENIMVLYCAIKSFETLCTDLFCEHIDFEEIKQYYRSIFLHYFNYGIESPGEVNEEDKTTKDVINRIISLLEKEFSYAIDYTKRLAFITNILPYEGKLFDYISFLYPVLNGLKDMPSLNCETIYLLLDDAHMLSLTQTQILNSWVATRTSKNVSLKISTQYNYKTYYTNSGASIDSPHDYSAVDMSTIYTTSYKDKYRTRIIDIIKKRFKYCNIEVSPEEFFPIDEAQESKIEAIANEYKKKFDCGQGRGHNRSDDAVRYARPDYIKSLAGISKSSSTYSYSGLDQLIHLSSGVIRYFLESAHAMYAKQKIKDEPKRVTKIDPVIQNEIVRIEASDYFFNELDKLKKEINHDSYAADDLKKLSNLIEGLGGLFRSILLSNRAERRIFSIAVSDEISPEVEKTIHLGIQLGYFHQSTIGKKNAVVGGRTRLYVLNRRLAPLWTLDPTGFAGYLFLKNKWLEMAIERPEYLLKRLLKSEKQVPNDGMIQMSLFNDDEAPIMIETFNNEEE